MFKIYCFDKMSLAKIDPFFFIVFIIINIIRYVTEKLSSEVKRFHHGKQNLVYLET